MAKNSKKKTRWEKDRDEDNADRAEAASQALSMHRQAKGNANEDEADFRDLLSDLMHYAKQEGLNFDEELDSACMNYNAEL